MNDPQIKFNDRGLVNIVLCMLVVLIESLQLLIAVVLICSFIPIPVSPMIHGLMPRQVQFVQPEREMFFYHFWVLTLMLGQAALLLILKKQLNTVQLSRRLWPFCAVEAGWLLLMVFAIFKIFVYGYPAWAMHLLYVILAGSIVSKLFWKEFQTVVQSGNNYLSQNPRIIERGVDVFIPVLLFGMIFVPDLQAVLARMWIGDDLIHMDTSLIGLVWAVSKGVLLNVGIWSHYGLGMPILIALIAKGFNLLSYTGILSILIWSSIIYFTLSYFLLRFWLKSLPLAVAGVLIAVKWQMFHPGNYPFVFTYPYSTIFRNLFDIVFIFLILIHIRRGNFYVLLAAGAVCGLALFHISDTGVYLLLAYVFYLFWITLEGIVHGHQDWKRLLGDAVMGIGTALLTALALLYIFQGVHAWSGVFWTNMAERMDLFLIGHGDLPMYKSLQEGDYSSSLMSFLVPLVYGAVLTAVCSLCFFKKIDRRHMMTAVLCVYGMGLYHYYVCRSANTAYYTVCIPFVFVLCWLCHQAGQCLSARDRYVCWGALLGFAVFALWTNHAFLNYPNIFNRSANPILASVVKWPNKDLPNYFNNVPRNMNPDLKLPLNSLGETEESLKIETDFKSDRELKEYFNREFDYSRDAALIDSLTAQDEPVALFSSFEVRILMQSDRKPFFYYCPIIDSLPRRMRMFPFSRMLTLNSLSVTMKQLEQSRPRYVFLEKIFLTRQVPKIYEYLYPELLYILAYLDKNYQPYKSGEYLVALKRI